MHVNSNIVITLHIRLFSITISSCFSIFLLSFSTAMKLLTTWLLARCSLLIHGYVIVRECALCDCHKLCYDFYKWWCLYIRWFCGFDTWWCRFHRWCWFFFISGDARPFLRMATSPSSQHIISHVAQNIFDLQSWNFTALLVIMCSCEPAVNRIWGLIVDSLTIGLV